MMKKHFLLLSISFFLAAPVLAADEKIDPSAYICAELVAASIDGQPPIFEGLQLDGYSSAKKGQPVADAMTLAPMLVEASDSCSAKPAEKALAHWEMARKNHPIDTSEAMWRADKTTCGDYAADPDEASGFVIWLDAYNRGQTGKPESILATQETLDHFLEVCKSSPSRLMLDVLRENAR